MELLNDWLQIQEYVEKETDGDRDRETLDVKWTMERFTRKATTDYF